MASLRYFAKRSLEIVTCRAGVPLLARRRLRDRAVVLGYHNIIPRGEQARGDTSLHLGQDEFAHQLDALRHTHDVVPLGELYTAVRGHARPRAAITVDDATSGALTAGLEELATRRLTATFFVAPAFVPGRPFWWDALGGLGSERRAHAIEALGGDDSAIRAWASRLHLEVRDVPAHQCCGSEEQLRAAVQEGMSVGSHSWSHRNLAALTAEHIGEELRKSLEWLEARFRTTVPWLAFPYGRYSDQVVTIAQELGYDGALRIEGGWIGRRPEPSERFRTPRVNVPAGLSAEGFSLRTAGLLSR